MQIIHVRSESHLLFDQLEQRHMKKECFDRFVLGQTSQISLAGVGHCLLRGVDELGFQWAVVHLTLMLLSRSLLCILYFA